MRPSRTAATSCVPSLVRRIESPDGTLLRRVPAEVLRKVALRAARWSDPRRPAGRGQRAGRHRVPSRLPTLSSRKNRTAQVMKLGQKQKLNRATQRTSRRYMLVRRVCPGLRSGDSWWWWLERARRVGAEARRRPLQGDGGILQDEAEESAPAAAPFGGCARARAVGSQASSVVQ